VATAVNTALRYAARARSKIFEKKCGSMCFRKNFTRDADDRPAGQLNPKQRGQQTGEQV
jgi:hypothetical protein